MKCLVGFLAGVAALFVTGCSLIPEYQRPDLNLGDTFKEDGTWRLAKPEDRQDRGDWWVLFKDPQLDQMETQLAQNNLELKVALARYDQATAFLSGENARLYPEINATGNDLTNRQSANRPLRSLNQPNVYGDRALGAGTIYEIDLWGEIRSAVTSAEALAAASKADVESVKLSLEAQLALNYIQLRGQDAQIALFEDAIEAYEKELTMIQHRHDEGIVSGLDVARSQTLLEQTKAQLYVAQANRAGFEHAIAALLGVVPSAFSLSPVPQWAVTVQYPVSPTTIPSQVLQRRPDIAAAERRVAAANAEIGVARAAFYPRISLAALGGFQNTGYGPMIGAPNSYWNFGPLAFYNIFDAGARQAVLDSASAKTREVAASYRNTVLNAFREVEDSLSQLHNLKEELQHQTAAATAAKRTYKLATNRYIEGAVSYLEVIDAETQRLTTEQLELNIKIARLQENVNLVRAIGGTW